MPGSLVFPNEGITELTDLMIRDTSFGSFTYLVDIYANDYDPDLDATASDFEICDFPGYGQIVVRRDQWVPAVLMGGNSYIACSFNPLTWNNNGPNTAAWGYLVRSSVTGSVLWCMEFYESYLIGLGKCLNLDLAIQFLSLSGSS